MTTLYTFTDPATGEHWSLEQNGADLLLCHIPDDAGPMASIPLPLAILAALAAAPGAGRINDERQTQMSIRRAA